MITNTFYVLLLWLISLSVQADPAKLDESVSDYIFVTESDNAGHPFPYFASCVTMTFLLIIIIVIISCASQV